MRSGDLKRDVEPLIDKVGTSLRKRIQHGPTDAFPDTA